MKINVKKQKHVSKVYNKNGDYYEYWICGMYYLGSVVSNCWNPFLFIKRKGAYFVSGFRTLNHPEKYDKAYISRDIRNQCFIYFVILSIGAILSYFLSVYIAIAAILVWLIVFFRNFNLDAEKAFEKYLIH